MLDTRITRRAFVGGAALAVAVLTRPVFAAGVERHKVDVCIYGGTSGGVIAAVALAKLGRSVILVENTRHLGGMTSSGLGLVDVGAAHTVGGLTRRYFKEIGAYYAERGVPSDDWHLEPHVAESIFERWIAAHRIEVVRESRLASVSIEDRRIRGIMLDRAPPDRRGAPAGTASEPSFMAIEAAMFIDCSYEGDLLASAGVSYRTDREGTREYAESFAGIRDSSEGKTITSLDPYLRPGDPGSGLVPLVSASAFGTAGDRSEILQPCSFRLCLTRTDPIAITPGDNYDPARFELVRRLFDGYAALGQPVWEGDLYFGFGHEKRYGAARFCKIAKLPNGKADLNGAGGLSLDFVRSDGPSYARAGWAERARIWQEHEDYTRGLLYFLRTDDRVPDVVRSELAAWGLPQDEFPETGGWPHQLYIREARRMVGSLVIDQAQCIDPRHTEHGIAYGSYPLDSHTCRRLVQGGRVAYEGGFNAPVKRPYPLPYFMIVPRAAECENLLVPFCVSSTHVAFASVRMEPPFMMMSEAAALAADQALSEGRSVQRIDIEHLRQRLDDAGQVVPGYGLIDRARNLFTARPAAPSSRPDRA